MSSVLLLLPSQEAREAWNSVYTLHKGRMTSPDRSIISLLPVLQLQDIKGRAETFSDHCYRPSLVLTFDPLSRPHPYMATIST